MSETTIVTRRVLAFSAVMLVAVAAAGAPSAVMLVAVAAAGAPSAFAKPHKCAGEMTANSRTVKNLRATGVSCSKARKVALPSGSKNFGVGFVPTNHYSSNGFSCRGSSVDLNGTIWTWTCKHKKQKITFNSDT